MERRYGLKPCCERDLGVVLLTTVTMIAMIAMLVLSCLQAVFLYIKASSRMIIEHQDFYQLEAITYRIGLFEKTAEVWPCLVEEKNPNRLIRLLLENRGCSMVVGKHVYRYLISDLGPYPCLQMASGKTNSGSHHWLISVINSHRAVMQLRIAKPSKTVSCPGEDKRLIQEGIISWRYLPAVILREG